MSLLCYFRGVNQRRHVPLCVVGFVRKLLLFGNQCHELCSAWLKLLPRLKSAGVPHLLRQKWSAVAAELTAAVQLAPFSNRVVRLAADDEAAVAPLLNTLAEQWGSEIAIGSYPVSGGVAV